MPLDPLAEKRIADLERDSAAMSSRLDQLTQRAIAHGERLKAAERRNKALWALSTTLFVVLLGGIGNGIYRAATVDATQATHGKRIDALEAADKELSKEFREHERRAALPKPEG